ncbi:MULTISPECIES: ABC transporter permease [Microbispora]|uniref:ABC transporter permease subunit n=3 Tax=Microbispora TaxID=2005 RepID=A0ABY3LPS1_9ACTN|nr:MULTISPECIES: ABC transporter permease subunit [Microbispora]RGA00762.1 ABC transporter permease subunit [Microbispora triticiradicis]TLP58643.1 ABC transporter permease subunit [Microbispora fusca]TYB45155.1 ABC transporter permease subunit [Microbispora tritici]GLW21319.1 membrane protein [Microbispora amethystogenes]
MSRARVHRLLGYGVVLVGLPVVWVLVRLSGAVPALLVPDPAKVADSLVAKVADPSALALTVARAVAGIGLGLVFGTALAIAAHLLPMVEPLTRVAGMIMRCVPVLALSPLIATFFGYGGPAAVATAAIMSFFPSFALVGAALWRIPPALVDVVRVTGGGRGRLLWYVSLPVALPELVQAAKLTSCVGVLAALTAEFLTANDGLGALLARSQGLLDTPTVWAILLTSLASSLLAYEVMDLAERRTRSLLSLHKN